MLTNTHQYVSHLITLPKLAQQNPGTYIGPSPWFPVGSFVYSPYKPGVKVFVSMTPSDYWLSKDPRIQALRGHDVTDSGPWLALAKLGLWIDNEIMVQNQDPPTIMALRIQYGYAWTPNALQPPIPVPPGLVFPGEPVYDPHATAGHIVSSVDKAAFKVWGGAVTPVQKAA